MNPLYSLIPLIIGILVIFAVRINKNIAEKKIEDTLKVERGLIYFREHLCKNVKAKFLKNSVYKNTPAVWTDCTVQRVFSDYFVKITYDTNDSFGFTTVAKSALSPRDKTKTK
jgi:hypothetical protein